MIPLLTIALLILALVAFIWINRGKDDDDQDGEVPERQVW